MVEIGQWILDIYDSQCEIWVCLDLWGRPPIGNLEWDAQFSDKPFELKGNSTDALNVLCKKHWFPSSLGAKDGICAENWKARMVQFFADKTCNKG